MDSKTKEEEEKEEGEVFGEDELREIFNELDKDGNGHIDKSELSKHLLGFGLPASKQDVSEWMGVVDRNHDGRVSFEEFEEFFLSRQSFLFKTFERLDLDSDGRLTEDELLVGLEELGFGDVTRAQVKEFIRRLSMAEHTTVDIAEFQRFIMTVPHLSVEAAFDKWMRATAIDFGEDVVVPDEGKRVEGPFVLLTAGGVAGAFSRTATAPFDRVKVLFQAGRSVGRSTDVGIGGMVREIWKEGGVRAFYKGNLTNVIKIGPESAIKFYVYENTRHYFATNPDEITIPQRLAAGATAGVTAQSLIYPLEIVKTRLAVAPSGTYRGIAHCFGSILTKEGPLALYRGLTPSLLGIVPYAGVDLCMYSFLKEQYCKKNKDKEPGVGILLSVGALSSTCGQLVSYPLALVRTKLQAQGIKGAPNLYSGMGDCFKKTLKDEGVAGLYRGLLPNFMKAIPAVAISYAVYEKTKAALKTL